jgi:hypothetical protein
MVTLNRIRKVYLIYMTLLVVGGALAGFVLESRLDRPEVQEALES